jgi:hypothetical protein
MCSTVVMARFSQAFTLHEGEEIVRCGARHMEIHRMLRADPTGFQQAGTGLRRAGWTRPQKYPARNNPRGVFLRSDSAYKAASGNKAARRAGPHRRDSQLRELSRLSTSERISSAQQPAQRLLSRPQMESYITMGHTLRVGSDRMLPKAWRALCTDAQLSLTTEPGVTEKQAQVIAALRGRTPEPCSVMGYR